MFAFTIGIAVGVVGLTSVVALYAPAESLFNRVVSWVRNKLNSE